GSMTPDIPRMPPIVMTSGKATGSAQTERPPICAPQTPTANMARKWSRPVRGCTKPPPNPVSGPGAMCAAAGVATSACPTMAGIALLLTAAAWSQAAGQPLNIVAAENFYGDVAQQLAGPDAKVTSILSNPDDDPHSFEASPSVARAIADARIVIENGADYDPWMEKLLGANRSASRTAINVADLVGRKPGDNPHLWYYLATMPACAKSL